MEPDPSEIRYALSHTGKVRALCEANHRDPPSEANERTGVCMSLGLTKLLALPKGYNGSHGSMEMNYSTHFTWIDSVWVYIGALALHCFINLKYCYIILT